MSSALGFDGAAGGSIPLGVRFLIEKPLINLEAPAPGLVPGLGVAPGVPCVPCAPDGMPTPSPESPAWLLAPVDCMKIGELVRFTVWIPLVFGLPVDECGLVGLGPGLKKSSCCIKL